eukprot:scaffold288028_cov30-Tisochrysis_lutea.AAC.2
MRPRISASRGAQLSNDERDDNENGDEGESEVQQRLALDHLVLLIVEVHEHVGVGASYARGVHRRAERFHRVDLLVSLIRAFVVGAQSRGTQAGRDRDLIAHVGAANPHNFGGKELGHPRACEGRAVGQRCAGGVDHILVVGADTARFAARAIGESSAVRVAQHLGQ